MRSLEAGQTLVVASHNPGKVWEIKQLIKPYGLRAVSAGDLDLPEPDETETTFAGNAKLKALAAATASGHPALADDSGLEVAALGGAPGIFSARWAGPEKDFLAAMQKVANEIEAKSADGQLNWVREKPAANFICVLCLAWPDGETQLFEGRVDGHLVWPARGGNGFGYDPMFVADGMQETFGEIAPEAKHALSHRRRAFDLFEQTCLADLPRTNDVANDDVVDGLHAAAANLSTQAEFVQFITHLNAYLASKDSAQQKPDLSRYLEALGAWTNNTVVADAEPKWRTFAKGLLAASMDT